MLQRDKVFIYYLLRRIVPVLSMSKGQGLDYIAVLLLCCACVLSYPEQIVLV